VAQKITRDVIDSHLACRFKSYLRLSGQRGNNSEYESWLTELITRERLVSIATLISRHTEQGIIREPHLALSTLADAPELVLDGMLENTIFSLRFDALIKVPGSSYLGNFHHIPILFHEGPVQPTQRLLLSLLSIAIAQIQERVPATGLIWRSQRVPATLDLLPYLDSARHVMNELSLVQTGASIPPLVLNRYCKVCE